MRYILVVFLILSFVSCETKPKEWAFKKVIKLDGINPIGIANANGELWLSDGDHNRLVQINSKGLIEETLDSLDRPMHIDIGDSIILIPEYGKDLISMAVIQDTGVYMVGKPDKRIVLMSSENGLDAPAAVSVFKSQKNEEQGSFAVADFYNNRILFKQTDKKLISFGKEGSQEGEFYYPTDVQITEDNIWVADAYNNRIQVFDKEGNFVKMIGQDQKMNAATGLFVSKTEVFITDFENNRVLVFDRDGQLKQELKEGIAKATDLLIKDQVLHIVNYRSGELVLYELQEKKE